MTKVCSGCNIELPIENFHTNGFLKSGKRRYHAKCKDCQKPLRSIGMKSYRERVGHDSEYHKAYRAANKDKIKSQKVLKKYGIDYILQLEKQEFKCAICGEEKQLVVDHDHDTGQTRELLCTQCNTGFGMFKENAEILYSAIKYAARWNHGGKKK